MRSLLQDFPADEPHNAQCGACHDPHRQTTPRQAVQSCAKGGCHAQPDTLTPYHRGLDAGVLENCLNCHKAHEFRIHGGGRDCLDCHQDIYRTDAPPPARRLPPAAAAPSASGDTGRVASAPRGAIRVASAGRIDPWLIRLVLAAHPGEAAVEASSVAAAAPQRDTVTFHHAQHRGVECTACHSMQREHGALTVTSIQDCRSCHHTQPVASSCTRCHAQRTVRSLTVRVRRTMDITVGSLNHPVRTLPFQHRVHEGLACTNCHTGGSALSAVDVNCSKCHESHHQPNRNCMACHEQPKAKAHNTKVHLGCAGAGCHQAAPRSVASVPRTRNFCLVCHQAMVNHNPGENCEACHVLPRPRAAAARPSGTAGTDLAEGT